MKINLGLGLTSLPVLRPGMSGIGSPEWVLKTYDGDPSVLHVDFVNGQYWFGGEEQAGLSEFLAALGGTSSYTRTGTRYERNATNGLTAFSSNAPCFAYDTSGNPLGIHLAAAAENLLLHSENASNWTPTGITVNADAIAAPNDATTADLLIESDAVEEHKIVRTRAVVSGTSYLFSRFLKAKERSIARMSVGPTGFAAELSVWFDLSSGTVLTEDVGATGIIEEYKDGWWRCGIIATANANATAEFTTALATADNEDSYDGDAASGLYVWGSQLSRPSAFSLGDVFLSYVATTTAEASSTADVLQFGSVSVDGRSIPFAGYGDGAGLWYYKFRSYSPGVLARGLSLAHRGSNISGQMYTRLTTAGKPEQYCQEPGGATGITTVDHVIAANDLTRVASKYAKNDFRTVDGSGASASDTAGNVTAAISHIKIGGLQPVGQDGMLFGYLEELAYFPGHHTPEFMDDLVADSPSALFLTGQAGVPPNTGSSAQSRYSFKAGVDTFTDLAGTVPVASDGDKVGQIKAGSFALIAADTATRPTYKTNILNAEPVLRFTAASSEELLASASSLLRSKQKVRFFAVVKYTNNSAAQTLLHFSTGAEETDPRAAMGVDDNPVSYIAKGRRQDHDKTVALSYATPLFAEPNDPFLSDWVIQEAEFDFINGKARTYINGHLIRARDDFQTPGATQASSSLAVALGSGFGQEFFDGDVAEILIVVGDYSAAERAADYEALTAAYAITVPDGVSGVTTWYNDQRSIEVGGRVAAGAVTPGGDVIVGYTDGKPWDNPPTILRANLEQDDHNNPALYKRLSDNRVVAMFSPHSGDNYFYAVSIDPDSIAAFGPAIPLGAPLTGTTFAYAHPVQLSEESGDPTYLFLRNTLGGGQNTTAYTKTLTDWSTLEASLTKLIDGTRPYTKIGQNGNARIDICCNDGHPSVAANNSLYHFYMQGGAFFDTAGNALGAPSFDPGTDLTVIYDGSISGVRSWVWEVTADAFGSGDFAVAFALFPDETSDHRYNVAYPNGAGGFDYYEVAGDGGPVYTDEIYYSGGICIDPENLNVVYCSRKISGVFQLFKYVFDGVSAFDAGEQLTFGTVDCLRPFVVRGMRKLTYVTEHSGGYASFTGYMTVIAEMDLDEVDVTPPAITQLSPADDATQIEIDTNFTATFSEPIQFGATVNIALYETDDTPVEAWDETDIGAGVSISGNILTINPTSDLSNGQGYYIQIASGSIEDTLGNAFAGIIDETTWNFTTVAIGGPTADSTAVTADDTTPTADQS